jgi:hypothetical protein
VRQTLLSSIRIEPTLASGGPVKTFAGRLGDVNAATTLNVYAHALESSDVEVFLCNILNNDGDY